MANDPRPTAAEHLARLRDLVEAIDLNRQACLVAATLVELLPLDRALADDAIDDVARAERLLETAATLVARRIGSIDAALDSPAEAPPSPPGEGAP